MSAADEDTLPQEDDGFEEMESSGSDEDDMEGDEQTGDGEEKVYVPGLQALQPGEELEMDRSAYRLYHECQTGQFAEHVRSINIDKHGRFMYRIGLLYEHITSTNKIKYHINNMFFGSDVPANSCDN